MVKIELEVSEIVAKFLNPQKIMEYFGESLEEVIESALKDAIKDWSGNTLEYYVKIFEGEK